jgi:hypothetical protein
MSPRIRDQSLENYRPTFAITVMTSELHVSVIPRGVACAGNPASRTKTHQKKNIPVFILREVVKRTGPVPCETESILAEQKSNKTPITRLPSTAFAVTTRELKESEAKLRNNASEICTNLVIILFGTNLN